MEKYHKINSIYKRNQTTKKIIEGDYSTPEFEYLSSNLWEFTEKVDGMNIRVGYGPTGLIVRGRTDNAQIAPQFLEYMKGLFPQGV